MDWLLYALHTPNLAIIHAAHAIDSFLYGFCCIFVFPSLFFPTNNTEELAELCGYGIHIFRRLFKKEFDVLVYQWLIKKRAENIRYRLSQSFVPLTDISHRARVTKQLSPNDR